MRLLIGFALPLLLLLAIAVVGLGAAAVLRMPHRPDLAAAPDRNRDRPPAS
ncbi:hypothetical protein [Kitasatospora sp. NPDC001547]|uniref:hypothetical protein n=1 Tax=Kitasatospora sp. NPDC001547 TaxID=3364015 RepID=UPI0036B26C0B